MKHVKLFEAFPDGSDSPRLFYGQDDLDTPDDMMASSGEGFFPKGRSQSLFNMLPKGLKNELPRPVKDMLANHTTLADWAILDDLMPKIERVMAKSGIQWNAFPGITGTSKLKYFDEFKKWLDAGYVSLLEDACFS
jgi:hypothetical protein